MIARVPPASGLLSGRYDEHTTFAAEYSRPGPRYAVAADAAPLSQEALAGVGAVYGDLIAQQAWNLSPRANDFAERWGDSVRHECTDRLLILSRRRTG